MNNRTVGGPSQIGTLQAMAVVGGVGGEADLVVDHDVDGAAGGEVGQVTHLHQLLVDALALEGRIPVQQDWDVFGAVDVLVSAHAFLLLCGACVTLADGVDGVEVGRVGQDHDVDFALFGHTLLSLPHVLFDITWFPLLVELIFDVFACEFP